VNKIVDKKNEYIEMYPDEFLKEIERNPIGYLPLGAMEWHSFHLPLGYDGLAAEYFFRELAKIKGGVVMPTVFYGVAENMPHPASMVISDNSYKNFLRSIFKGLINLNFRILIVATGHWSINQMKCLIDTAIEVMSKNKDILISGLPLGFICMDDGIKIDHAGKYETSLGMALFPDKVRLERLGKKYLGQWKFPDVEQLAEFGIEGDDDPRQTASSEYGEKILNLMLKKYSELIDEMLSSRRSRLDYYHSSAINFTKTNFSDFYKDIDPVKFYKKVSKIIKKKKYF